MSHPLTPEQVGRGMRLSIIDGMTSQMFYGVTSPGSVFLTGLALLLGASNFEIGLLSAIGPLLSGVFLLAAVILEKVGRRKPYYLLTAAIHRGVFFALLMLPFLPGSVSPGLRVAILISVVFVSMLFGVPQGAAWMSWMADMVPVDRRGAFFGRRNMLCGGLWMAMSFVFGKFIDAHNSIWGYSSLFMTGTALGLLALLVAARQPEPPLAVSEKRPTWLAIWKDAYASPSFRNFLLFQIAWGFTTSLAGPFYNVYMLKGLHVSMATITLWGIVGGVVGTVTMPYWGFLGDRAGNRATLLLCLIGSCINAFGWLLVTPDNMQWALPVIFALGGFFDTGAGLLAFNMLLGILPQKNNTSYLAIYETAWGTTVGVAPAVGGYLATVLPHVQLSGTVVNPILAVIAMSTVLRIFTLVFVKAMPSQRGRGVRFVFKEYVLTNPFKLFTSLYLAQKSPEEKLEAIDTLSQMKTKAATPELIRSMRDLNPRVRLRSVRAMGEIGDTQAIPALMEVLDDPLEDLQVEAISAMGKIGDPRAVPVLTRKLESPDHHVQRSAALALGDLKAVAAVDALVKLMVNSQSTMAIMACADALGRIREYRAVEPLLEITRTPRTTQVKRALVASAGMLVDDDGKLYTALSQPDTHSTQSAEEILSHRTVRLARPPQSPLRRNLTNALAAFHRRNYNEAILEMKVVSQVAVREYLARKELKDAVGFDHWVRLLDSNYSIQLEAVQRIDTQTGIGLAVVDYYARHCPSASEPDMDSQEFLLALYAFKTGQEGVYQLLYGRSFLQEQILPRLKGLSQIMNVG